MNPPQNPAGEFVAEITYGAARRGELVAIIETAPAALLRAVQGLSPDQLDTRYRNWTIRQIVHHLADSHVNVYIRFKWTLTEETPTIKAYEEGKWAELDDSRLGDVQAPLALMEGLHAQWVQLLRAMREEQFLRSFKHPESGRTISLSEALSYYAWHCRHHTAQILWIREQRGL